MTAATSEKTGRFAVLLLLFRVNSGGCFSNWLQLLKRNLTCKMRFLKKRSNCKVSSGFGIVNSGKWKTGLWKAWKRTVDFSTLPTARTTTATMSRDEIIIIVIRTVDLKGIVIPWCYLDQGSVLKTPCCAGSGETHKKHMCEMWLHLFFRVNSARPDPYHMAPAPGSHHVSNKPR